MKPQCITAAECLRELARVMEQFGIDDIFEAVTSKYVYEHDCVPWGYSHIPRFELPKYWRFAIAEVEGKPVFPNDDLFNGRGRRFTVEWFEDNMVYGVFSDLSSAAVHIGNCSWNPPRPKTVMVEMLVDDAVWMATSQAAFYNARAAEACKKALEELK